MLSPDYQTKFAKRQAEPVSPAWSILDAPIPSEGRAPTKSETLRLSDFGLEVTPTWRVTRSDGSGRAGHLWQPAAERWVRLAVSLIWYE